MRIGQGFDVHPLVVGRKLMIGGVEIQYEKGLEGHSDADVLLHAICDALLEQNYLLTASQAINILMGETPQAFHTEVSRARVPCLSEISTVFSST